MTFPYRVPPMGHQVEGMRKAYPQRAFALFHEMGCGKTFTTINIAAARYMKGAIDALLVICPTPIKLVWEDEIERMMPEKVETDVFIMESGRNMEAARFMDKRDESKLKIFIVGIEALSQGKAGQLAQAFAARYSTMTVIDESSKIKNPKAARTKKIIAIGERSEFRIILTGTPITQGIEDLYGQFAFLNPSIIGLKSFFTFKNRYCIMGGFEGKKVLGYQQISDLMKRVAPYIHAVKTVDALDLPDKSYTKLIVKPTKEQTTAIKSLKDLFEAEDNGDILITKTILERLTRYQQICGGSFPYNDIDEGGYKTKPISGKNPKLEALLDHIDGVANDSKALVWCRFRPEIDLVSTALRDKYGDDAVVEFHGGVDYNGRKQAIASFQDDPSTRFFVVNQSTGGMGITLTAASLAYYFSNSFSYEERLQSEARIWRKGQTKSCLYVDLLMDVAYDKMVIAAIAKKQDMAQYVDQQIEHHQSVAEGL